MDSSRQPPGRNDALMRMSYPEALDAALCWGSHITRESWSPGQWVAAHRPGDGQALSGPFLVLRTSQGALVHYLPTDADTFAQDWTIDLDPQPPVAAGERVAAPQLSADAFDPQR